MVDIDKKILESMRTVSRGERDAIMSAFEILKNKPETRLYMALFRDIIMFKDMTNAFLMDYKLKIRELEDRVVELEQPEGR